MAVTVSQALVAKLGVDLTDFSRGMKRGERLAGRMGERMQRNFKRISVAVAAVGVAALAMGATFARSVIRAASTSENLRIRLDALLGSTQEGARAFEAMSEFAARVPFQFEDIMASATQLAGVLEGGVDEIKATMPIIADLAAVSGLSIQDTTGQIVRMFSAGAGAADLFRERGITAMLGFQAGATVSAEDTRRQVIAAFNDIDSKFRGAAGNLADTWDGLMSMISDRWFQFRNLVAQAGLFDVAKGALADLVAKLDELAETDALRRIAERVNEIIFAAVRGIGQFLVATADAIQFVIKNPLLSEFGLIGLYFFGPKGSAALALIGFGIDQLTQRLAGPTTEIARVQQTVDDLAAGINRLATLRTKLEGGLIPPEAIILAGQLGVATSDTDAIIAEISARIERFTSLLTTNATTLGRQRDAMKASEGIAISLTGALRQAGEAMSSLAGSITEIERVQQTLDDLATRINRLATLRTKLEGGLIPREAVTLARELGIAFTDTSALIAEINRRIEQSTSLLITNVATLDALRTTGEAVGGGAVPGKPTETRAAQKLQSAITRVNDELGLMDSKLKAIAGERLREVRARMEAVRAEAERISDTVVNQLGHGITNAILGFQSMGDVIKRIGESILREIVGALTRAVAKAIALKVALAAIDVAISVASSIGIAALTGGAAKAQRGLVLPSFAPGGFGGAIPILAHPGEAVLNRQAVERIGGAPAVNAINQGSGGGGISPFPDAGGSLIIENFNAVFPNVTSARDFEADLRDVIRKGRT